MKNEIIPFFSRIETADDLYRSIDKTDWFFTPESSRLHMKAYCKLFTKQYAEAAVLFRRYADSLENSPFLNIDELLSEPNVLTKLIMNDPEKAYLHLCENIVRSTDYLQVEQYQRNKSFIEMIE